MLAHDEPGVMAELSTKLAQAGISIEAMRQYESATEDGYVPLVMVTHRVVEKKMDETIAKIEALNTIQGSVVRIRMEHLD
jgi:homoserine dehydrogenase